MTVVRRLGDGYEPHVDEEAGRLTYSLPVDSSFMNRCFAFGIEQDDLEILLTDPYRRAVLEVVAHTVLQRAMGPSPTPCTQGDFDRLVDAVLRLAPADLEAFIDRIGRDYNTNVAFFVDKAMARPSGD